MVFFLKGIYGSSAESNWNLIYNGDYVFNYLQTIKTLRRFFEGIIYYFDFDYANGASEGFNNKISAINRAAFGFRVLE